MPRRWTLSLALWLIFALTLALALGVREHIRAGRRVVLEPQARQGMRLNAPAGWASRQVNGALLFEEPAPPGKGRRRLEIAHAQAGLFLSPLDYLVRSGELPARDAAALLAAGDAEAGQLKPLVMGGWPGILISQTRLLRIGGPARAVPWKQSVACAVLPGGSAIVVRLEGEGVAGEEDEQLVRDVAGGIELTAQAARPAEGELVLEDDIRVAVPPGWAAAASADPFRLGATLAPRAGGDYLAVEVVPCLLPPGDPGALLAGMAILRDPLFVPGPVRKVDDRTFACDRADPVAPACVWLRVDGQGRALLADFRWHPSSSPEADRQRMEAAWRALGEGIAFGGDSPVPAMVEAGRAELARVPADPADWLEGAPLEHWQWYDDASPRVGRTVRRWTVDAQWIAVDEVTENSPASPGAWIVRQWRLRRDGAVYEHTLRRGGSGGAMAQQAHLAEGTLRIALLDASASAAQGSGQAPELFIPGGLLPLAVGRAEFEPMLLRAESITWPGEPAAPQPMVVVFEPSFDVPRLPGPEQEPMRCWRVRISGRPDCGRWYLDGAGRLQAVHYAGGVQARRVEAGATTLPSTRPVSPPLPGPGSRPAAPGR